MENNRLSSDYLYSYTKNFETLKNILRGGFRYSRNVEKLPYKSYEQENYIVCFCDILPKQAEYHKSIYGSNALSLTKDWGIRNRVSPLRYVHNYSPGCLANYIKVKNDLRIAIINEGDKLGDFLTLINFIEARKKGYFTEDRIEDEIGNIYLDEFLKGINNRFQEKKEKFGSKCLVEIYNDWVIPLLTILKKTINELEIRDSYMRIYQGDFREIKDKILYDEREWRAVKFISHEDKIRTPNIEETYAKLGYLPDEYNLKFDATDIYEILVESNERKIDLTKFINDELPAFKRIIKSIRPLNK